MPTTRRSSGNAARRTTGRQATLSFNHRVTKPAGPKSTKDLVSATKPAKQSPLAKHVSSAQPESTDEEDVKKEEDDVEEAKIKVEEEPLVEVKHEPEAKSEAELRAEKVPGRQIDQYWRKLERERTSKRVHQEDLTQAEKILRYWDVSSQYGVSNLHLFHFRFTKIIFANGALLSPALVLAA